jgi:hypothetical protein
MQGESPHAPPPPLSAPETAREVVASGRERVGDAVTAAAAAAAAPVGSPVSYAMWVHLISHT